MNVQGKAKYIESLQPGQIIAFKTGDSTLSGKVTQISDDFITVETKNKTAFIVSEEDIVWVKTGQRWPKGVFLALKGEIEDGIEQ